MTFSEYINQENPRKNNLVWITPEDCFSIFDDPGRGKLVTLLINNTEYTYLLTSESGRLYTIDEDGNKNQPSCFFWKADADQQTENADLRDLTKENVQPGMVIINKNNPEWGTFGILEKYGDGIWEIRGDAGTTTLFEGEFHFWSVKR